MKGEVKQYRTLITNLRTIRREISSTVTRIERFEKSILNGFVVNDEVSFNKELNNLKSILNSKIDSINNDIIPSLEAERDAILASYWGAYELHKFRYN